MSVKYFAYLLIAFHTSALPHENYLCRHTSPLLSTAIDEDWPQAIFAISLLPDFKHTSSKIKDKKETDVKMRKKITKDYVLHNRKFSFISITCMDFIYDSE